MVVWRAFRLTFGDRLTHPEVAQIALADRSNREDEDGSKDR